MKRIGLACAILVAAGAGFGAGILLFSPRPDPVARPEAISAAQSSSSWGPDPIWIRMSGNVALFRGVRDRAYAFCFRDEAINRSCADEQDSAVQGAVLALQVAADWRQMRDKSHLGQAGRWIAENPDVATRIRNYCWSLYTDHGSRDARILGSCLGNLSLYTALIDLPVE